LQNGAEANGEGLEQVLFRAVAVYIKLYVIMRAMPLLIAGLAFAVFTGLLLAGKIGEASYCFLVAGSALLGLVLHGFSRLQELDLKNLRLVLRQIEETKKELFVREEKLKALAAPLAQIVAFTGASEGRFGSKESSDVKRRWYRKKVEQLISALEFTPSEMAEARKYMDLYDEFDVMLGEREVLKTTDPDYREMVAKLDKASDRIIDVMKKDLSE
jgi:hypothetical protein